MATDIGPGDGTTITHSGIVYLVENITIDGHEIGEVGTADLTAVARTWVAGNIVEWGILTCDCEWDPSVAIPTLGGAASALVLTPQGAGTPDIYTCNAYLRSMGAVIPLGAKMTANLTFRLTDVWVKS